MKPSPARSRRDPFVPFDFRGQRLFASGSYCCPHDSQPEAIVVVGWRARPGPSATARIEVEALLRAAATSAACSTDPDAGVAVAKDMTDMLLNVFWAKVAALREARAAENTPVGRVH